jgi:hypothetical protein
MADVSFENVEDQGRGAVSPVTSVVPRLARIRIAPYFSAPMRARPPTLRT